MTDPTTNRRWSSTDNDESLAAEWLDGADRMDRMLAPFGDRMLARAALSPGQTVLDIGCGTGATTLAAWTSVAPTGAVIGVDISPRMLHAAQLRATSVPGHRISYIRADAQNHPFQPGQVDVAISRFGVGHFRDPAAAFTNIAAGLRPGGRLVVTEWAGPADNEWMTLADTVGARVLPDRWPHQRGPTPGLPRRALRRVDPTHWPRRRTSHGRRPPHRSPPRAPLTRPGHAMTTVPPQPLSPSGQRQPSCRASGVADMDTAEDRLIRGPTSPRGRPSARHAR
jgi:SAM-dependent methyltransferase